jgi:DNA-binding transcriptional LysR family regulator
MDRDIEPGAFDSEALRRLNLNLLHSLDAILNAPSLAEAGRQVSLSQPAMSGALRRLRDQFGDELIFFIAGERMLTPLAEALRPRVRQLLVDTRDLFDLRIAFDPGTANRDVVIAAPEALEILLLGRISRELLREAPHVRLTVRPLEGGSASESLGAGADMVLISEQAADDSLPSSPLIRSHLACMVWNEHPNVGESITNEEYRSSRHVVVEDWNTRFKNLPQASFETMSARRAAVRTSFYSALPRFVIGTDLIATADSWLLQFFSSMMPLRTLSAPFDTPIDRIVVQWSRERDGDAMLAWLLNILQRHMRAAGGESHN